MQRNREEPENSTPEFERSSQFPSSDEEDDSIISVGMSSETIAVMEEEEAVAKNLKPEEEEETEKRKSEDAELFTCMLQPLNSDADPDYVGIRRILLHRKASAGVVQRKVFFPCR